MNQHQKCPSEAMVNRCENVGLRAGFVAISMLWASLVLAQAAPDENAAGGANMPAAPEAPVASAPDSAQSVSQDNPPPPAEPVPYHFALGVGFKVSTLGAGFDVAVPVTHNTNVRLGYSGFLDVDHNFSKDNINYNGNLSLHSFNALFDYFPFSGVFHLSGGFTYGSIIKAKADASAAGGSQFSLNGTDYTSSTNNPVTGHATIDFREFAPMVSLGWGNLVPREGRFSFSFEIGAVFQGSGRSKLNLAGTACQGDGTCPDGNINVATDPTVQANIMAEQGKLDHEVKAFDLYPILSLGLGYRF